MTKKEYNPCGDLTGREREFCDEATKSYFNLPYVEVMRTISIKAISELENEKNFPNVAALENWASYNLNEVEQRASLNFDTFTTLQAGLAKYLVHLLYENRYNIHYNCLADFVFSVTGGNFVSNAIEEIILREMDSLAQEADYFTTVDELNGELLNFILN
ncbi:MAG: hypothetical protein IKZ53_10670 [Selenomonadaceae bacterium]|nr:hypothetical protein [Selenomonadaceae bacterium]